MKIDNQYLNQIIGQQTKQSVGGKDKTAFSDLLRNTDSAEATEKAGSTTGMGGVITTSATGSILAAQSIGKARNPETELEGLLDSLDRYSQAMADESMTLKDIEPLVTELEQGTQSLNALKDQLPQDHAIRPVIEDAAVLASVETIKFRRGDYL